MFPQCTLYTVENLPTCGEANATLNFTITDRTGGGQDKTAVRHPQASWTIGNTDVPAHHWMLVDEVATEESERDTSQIASVSAWPVYSCRNFVCSCRVAGSNVGKVCA